MSNENVEDLKHKAVAGTFWNFMSNILTKLASMVVQLVLARLILPEEFGTVALLNVFITISNVFTTTGFASAIIQKKDLTETDKASAHYISVGVSVLMYGIIFLIAPWVGKFYNDPALCDVLRVYGIVIVIAGTRSVHNALVRKEMRFRINLWSGVITVLFQGTVGIVLAYLGWGVWALVCSYITGSFVGMVYIKLMVRWKPQRVFSWKAAWGMFRFSSNVLLAHLFNTVYSDIRALLIGKVYDAETLAYYDRANLIRGYVFDTTIGAISTVMLPVLSKVNDDVNKVKQGLRRIVRLNMYVSTPMRVGLILVAEPLILLLLGQNWVSSAPFLQLICITNLLAPTLNRTNAYLAIGKSKLSLRSQLINKGCILLLIFATAHISVYMVVLSALVGNLISFVEGLMVNKKYLGYSIREQLVDVLPALALSVVMGVPVYLVSLLGLSIFAQLALQCTVGLLTYILLSVVVRYESFYYLVNLLKNMLLKKTGGKKET